VVFTGISETPGAWSGVTYASGSTGSLSGVTIEYAQHALTLNTANPVTVTNSALRYNRHAPAADQLAYGAGLTIQQGSHLIEGTQVYSNTATATGTGGARCGRLHWCWISTDCGLLDLRKYCDRGDHRGRRVNRHCRGGPGDRGQLRYDQYTCWQR
jgi:hypothetical protein